MIPLSPPSGNIQPIGSHEVHGSDTSEMDVPSHPGLNPVRTLSQGNQLANLFSSYSLLSTRASSGGIAPNHDKKSRLGLLLDGTT